MITITQLYNVQPSNCSDFYYRVEFGAKSFIKTYKVKWQNVINFHPNREKLFLEADLAIVNFVCDIDVLHLVYLRYKSKKPTIFEINDNFFAFQKDNPMYSFYSDKNNQKIFLETIKLCDAVQVSSPFLVDYLNINKEVVYLPNNIKEKIVKDSNKIEQKLRIGWGGSSGHYEDIKNISSALIDFINNNENVELWIKGDNKIKSLFNSLPKDKLVYEEFSSLKDYERFLSNLNVAIATIESDDFNKTRSDVKYIEYVKNGVVPILKDFGPYSLIDNSVCKNFNNSVELHEILQFYYNNRERINEDYIKNRDYINKNRLEINNVENRYNLYSRYIDLKKGVGEYELLDIYNQYPWLYDYLSGKIDFVEDIDNVFYYRKKYYNSIEKLKYAIKTFAKNSPSIWQLLIQNYQIKDPIKAKKLIKQFLMKFPVLKTLL